MKEGIVTALRSNLINAWHLLTKWRVFFKFFCHRTDLKKRAVWLIGERAGLCGKDNGYHFFQYCRKHAPERAIYFLVSPSSRYYEQFASDQYVVPYGGDQHLLYLLAARVVLFSDSPIDVQYRTRLFLRKKFKVFLTHGIWAFKKVPDYDWETGIVGKNIDLSLAASNWEKKWIEQHYHFPPDRIAVTGLLRLDALYQSRAPKREIILMPTWRRSLQDMPPHLFRSSDVFQFYDTFLRSEGLQDILQRYDLTLNFIPHQHMRSYYRRHSIAKINSPRIRFFTEDHNVQTHLIEASLLITDYSSVAFDFAYLDKPVVFCYVASSPSHPEEPSRKYLEENAPGPVVDNTPDLTKTLETLITRGFTIEARYQAFNSRYFSYRDNKNCERLFSIVNKLHHH